MLSYLDRKGRLPFGAVMRTAEKLELSFGHVSQVLHGRRRDVRVEKALAKLMKVSALEAFGEPPVRNMARRGRWPRRVAA